MKSLLFSAILVFALSQANAQKVQVADNCETNKGWSGSQPIMVDVTDAKEGSASLKTEGEGPFRFRKGFSTPVNTGLDGKSGYMAFWLYASEVTDFETNPGLLQISSSGKSELNAHHWRLKSLNLQKGWNKVVFELNADSTKGGDFDGSNFNYFMLIQKTATSVVLKIDNIRFAKELKDL